MSDVHLSYTDGDGSAVRAVDGVSLEVPRGTTVVLTGPSGCGKSSVLAVAGTLIRPDSGRVEIGGIRVDGLSVEELAAVRREHVGLVFQHDNLVPGLTAEEQVLLAVHVGGRRPSRHRGQARELLAAVGLDGAFGRLPGQLSGGMRQRVNIARALIMEPDVLLIDEPTSALDSRRGAEVMDLLREVTREREVASLLVTHDLGTVGDADTVLHMKDGALVAEAAAVS
ncbi:ABC transporter ATP-binding protein [Gordonia neofelifaecis]|uniref:Abc transporter related protein n=1 Tax=Gordonia neofelifaecis NRRL B-59395 TaxID=644548 RepID=F1YFG8_9ACTN|nr:ABC transporter ATP-binding protein [Gordonia neofelifaecis]EGD56456.1 abc transporter related protein [Gordonia neofelifaecis NRRL B-59395]